MTTFPVEAYSWKVLQEDVALKSIDKTCIEHNVTGIPKEVLFFFLAENLDKTKRIKLSFKGKPFLAQLKVSNSRVRMFWSRNFSELLEKHLPPHRNANEYGNTSLFGR